MMGAHAGRSRINNRSSILGNRFVILILVPQRDNTIFRLNAIVYTDA